MTSLSPIDYAATRKALVAVIAYATGLPNYKIIREQAAGPVQPRPKRPFCSFKYRVIAMRAGQDALFPAPDVGPTMYRYSGERGIMVDVSFYSDDQDEAYGLAAAWQFGLSEVSVREMLDEANLCVWTVNDATDVSTLLSSGFEARALVECELWTSCERVVDLGSIDAVEIAGKVLHVDDRTALTVSAIVETEG